MRNKILPLSRSIASRLLRSSALPSKTFTSKMISNANHNDSAEEAVGICTYVSSNLEGFHGIHKQRYSDFIVREVTRDGEVCCLRNTSGAELEKKLFDIAEPPSGESESASPEELTSLVTKELKALSMKASGSIEVNTLNSNPETDSLEEKVKSFILACLSKSDDCPNDLTSFPCPSKEARGSMHQCVRKYLSQFVDSDTVQVDGNVSCIRLIAKHKIKKGGGRGGGGGAAGGGGGGGGGEKKKYDSRGRQWPTGLGNFLRFTMFKENIDTMSACNILTRALRVKPGAIEYSGTKDKRAVTAQKCTIYRKKPSDLERMNKFNHSPLIRLGDFEYVNEATRLGELSGNRFGIVLRAVTASNDVVNAACRSAKENGFINYFGLQRFGKGGSGSHHLGRALFKSDWQEAVNLLFTQREGDRSEIATAKAFYFQKDYESAHRHLPSNMMNERRVLESLARTPTDFLGAFNRIPKNTRLLCAHAYQSFVWNMAASERIRRYGNRCIVGDIVATVSSEVIDRMEASHDIEETENDETVNDNEVGELPAQTPADNDTFQRASKLQAGDIRTLTEADIASGKYTIKDVLLPLVGSGIIFPANEIADYYKSLLAKDGITMENFSVAANQYRMNGAYRRLIQVPKDFNWHIIQYNDPNAELVTTELSLMRSGEGPRSISATFKMPDTPDIGDVITSLPRRNANDADDGIVKGEGSLRAIVLNFTLSSGTYATMMLRELTKESTETQYQAQLSAQHILSVGNMDVAGASADKGNGDNEGLDASTSPAPKKSRLEEPH